MINGQTQFAVLKDKKENHQPKPYPLNFRKY